ncbi:hypothetical protein [Phytohabitans flavus]|nr:hypothetical protein [Phytohabitans flavus]
MPGSDPDPTRPEHREDEPTAVTPPADDDGVSGVKPTLKEPPRWSGSAAVPPPSEKKRKRWLATAHDLEVPGPAPSPPPRDPTMQMSEEERRAYESGAPVDPWADADPLDQPYPRTLLDVPHAPPLALPPAPPPQPPALPPARRQAAPPHHLRHHPRTFRPGRSGSRCPTCASRRRSGSRARARRHRRSRDRRRGGSLHRGTFRSRCAGAGASGRGCSSS